MRCTRGGLSQPPQQHPGGCTQRRQAGGAHAGGTERGPPRVVWWVAGRDRYVHQHACGGGDLIVTRSLSPPTLPLLSATEAALQTSNSGMLHFGQNHVRGSLLATDEKTKKNVAHAVLKGWPTRATSSRRSSRSARRRGRRRAPPTMRCTAVRARPRQTRGKIRTTVRLARRAATPRLHARCSCSSAGPAASLAALGLATAPAALAAAAPARLPPLFQRARRRLPALARLRSRC